MCSMIVPSANSQSNCKKKGFALVLALALLSLVFLLVISLVNLVSTDLSLVEARKEKILAQAHARMGMKIAMGEIQKHLGPDMRISATADLLDERIESGKNYENSTFSRSQSSNQGVDLNEDGRIDPLPYGQRHWTGVWKHRGRDRGVDQNKLGARPLPENTDTGDSLSEYVMASTEFDPHPAIEIAWLVSGNEGFNRKLYFGNNPLQLLEFVEIPDGNLWDTDQSDNGRSFVKGGIYGKDENAWEDYSSALLNSPLKGSGLLPEYNHPIFELPDPLISDDVEWMLVSPLLKKDFDPKNFDLYNPETWENDLSSEPVKARKTRVQHEVEGNDESQYGAYAYWVGDEGVKTKVSVQNPFKEDFSPQLEGERTTTQIQKDNLAVATEPNLSFSVNTGSLYSGFGIDWIETTSKNKKKDILSLDTLSALCDSNSEISAHYHSLTTDSFGVLSDVRTGGLKRDLSSAFANEEDWGNLQDSVANAWADDFGNYIYKHRIFYMKSVPLGINAKENDWRIGSDQTLLEEHGILAGPRWTTMGSFHNLYLASSYGDITPDEFPRIVGDNNVLFNHLFPFGVRPNSPGNNSAITSSTRLRQNFNYFRGLEKRPEPKNHPIQPVLVEIKYSHHPLYEQGQLGLAAYPSVAFWNPYNVPISNQNIFIEIPFQVGMETINAKHYDLYRKWWMYCFDQTLFSTANPGVDPTQPTFQIPPGFKNFEDRNGNGKKDPGEPWVGVGSWQGTPRGMPTNRDDFMRNYNNFGNIVHLFPRASLKLPLNYGGLVGTSLGNNFNGNFIFSNNPESPTGNGDRHLLLEINGLSLDPGEKAHFTVKSRTSFSYSSLPPANQTSFINVELDKLTSGEEDNHIIFLNGDTSIGANEPVSIRYWVWGYRGVFPNAKEAFNTNGERIQNSSLEPPKGITIYSEDPRLGNSANRRIIGKINKQFSIEVGSGISDYASCNDLSFTSSGSYLPGCGFRIRLKLPAKTENIVLEQFNLRALVHSNQDGFGDNWDYEEFSSSHAYGSKPTVFRQQGSGNSNTSTHFLRGDGQIFDLQHDYPNFYSLPALDDDNVLGMANFSTQSNSIFGLDPDFGVMPRASSYDSSIGFFHDDDTLGPMQAEEKAILFEIPNSPMLSIFQFRHANLNNYSHGPSYALGNSYASPQVARYKTWGKMKGFSMQPKFPGMNIPENISIAQELQNAGLGYNPFIWLPHREISYDDPIREKFVNHDHQNVTLDHSFYLNYGLLDGYFVSGLGIGQAQGGSAEWEEANPDFFDPGIRFLPFRNPRLIPYFREVDWKNTKYAEKSPDLASAGTDLEYRYQTLSSDLLVDGAFNVNSTSVDAWASQLSSLRGQDIEGATIASNETPIPRFLASEAEDSWNKTRKLSDEEINLLAHKIVEQVKLRGPFLSYADFVNRRIQGNKINLLGFPFSQWNTNERKETRSSALGLRGAIQAGIAEAKLNSGGFTSNNSDPLIPVLPTGRFTGNNVINNPWPLASEMNLLSSEFGIHAISSGSKSFADHNLAGNVVQLTDYLSYPPIARSNFDPANVSSGNPNSFFVYPQKWGKGFYEVRYENPGPPAKKISMPDGSLKSFQYHFDNFEDTFYYGEAPENLLAVENVATGANKPGWVMQSDLLSPLAPVTSVRSDTFVVRVMGETLQKNNDLTPSKAWIELTVQRVPDYLKADLDNPHHRPHEPFEDRNFNGYWDADLPGSPEHWIDFNQNSVTRNRDGSTVQVGSELFPDLAGDNPSFADGLESDLSITKDPDEEVVSNMNSTVSHKGINQRFGRRFKIIKFRWLKAQEV